MKILLCNPPVRTWAPPAWIPSGLAYVAAVLRLDGHSVRLLDLNVIRPAALNSCALAPHFGAEHYDLVGIGGLLTSYHEILAIKDAVRALCPLSPVIAGGPISAVSHLLLERGFDAVVLGEGEESVRQLVRDLAHGYLAMTYTYAGEPLDIDSVPLPAWDLLAMDEYLRHPIGFWNTRKWEDGENEFAPKTMNLLAGRGCPYQCKYCAHDFLGTRYRVRSPACVVNEMKVLNRTYGVKCFQFMDDEFVAKPQFAYEFCDLVEKTGFEWGCTGRVNIVDKTMLGTMRRCGCRHISYGIESGSQAMLDAMDKRVNVQQACIALRSTVDANIQCDYSVMIGYPGENDATLEETVAFCKRAPVGPGSAFFCTPYPGTELWRAVRHLVPDEHEYLLRLGEQGRQIALNICEVSNERLWEVKGELEAIGE